MTEIKKCSDCKELLPYSEFYKRPRDGVPLKRCKKCHSIMCKSVTKKEFENSSDPQVISKYEYKIDNRLKKLYGITLKEYNIILKNQKGRCPICLLNLKGRKPCVDHNHKNNITRQILCNSCNLVLGYFKDSKVILKSAIKYIRKHNEN